ncbi:hypothetical protein ACHAXR_010220 [Thalassiosira sp. AJA248-18]
MRHHHGRGGATLLPTTIPIITSDSNGSADGGGGAQQQQQQRRKATQSAARSARNTSAISSSVVFHDSSLHSNSTSSNYPPPPPTPTPEQQTSPEDCELYDDIDDLYPHEHEGGKVVSDPHNSISTSITSYSRSGSDSNGGFSSSMLSQQRSRSGSTTSRGRMASISRGDSNRSLTSSLIQSLRTSNLSDRLPTDYDSLVASSNDGTLSHMIAGIDDIYKRSTNTALSQASTVRRSNESAAAAAAASAGNNGGGVNNEVWKGSKRESIVGGKMISEMSFQEQRPLMAPDRSDRSLVINIDEGDLEDEAGKNKLDESDSSNRSNTNKTQCTYSSTIASSSNNENENSNVIVSSVDWSSLSKSCKRAKNAFRDIDSGQMVVKNMFVTHLNALTTVLTLYAQKYCGSSANNQGDVDGSNRSGSSAGNNNRRSSLEEMKVRTTETKRALRFAMSCLAPPRVGEDSTAAAAAGIISAASADGDGDDDGGGGGAPPPPGGGQESQDGGVEKYRIARRYRQELQEAAVKGFASTAADGEMNQGTTRESRHNYGLHIPLVDIIYACDKGWNLSDVDDAAGGDEEKRAKIVASVERDKRTVRVLAARMLCNLVTDNPLAAAIILSDVPFSPTSDQVERRMAGTIMGSREQQRGGNNRPYADDGEVFWTDLVTATAKEGGGDASGIISNGKQDDGSQDREALAAVAAALHNLLTSSEARESLLELDEEMKRRESAKQRKALSRLDSSSEHSGGISEVEVEVDHQPMKPIDVGFEVASNMLLMNSLLRNILPARAVILQAQFEKERAEATGPKFKPPAQAADNMSDSATEWISLVLERLASRGLLPSMLRSAGGTKSDSITPEQVVLVSCIRQAVDDFHSALTITGAEGGFGRRRLSIAAKTSGMTVTTRPHPLWGRADLGAGGKTIKGRDSRTAVPVLLSLANEVEEIRLRANALREGKSIEMYDGEQNCTQRIVDDMCDILAQSLGRHAPSLINLAESQGSKQCIFADARSVLGRETSLISSCCQDLGRILDTALARNSGKKAREMTLSSQDQQTAIVMVRLIGNIIYQCRYNQDLLRITPAPPLEIAIDKSVPSNTTGGVPMERTGLHVILSATSLAPACFTLREWCIVAIRNAIEGNAANAETVRRLEANQVLDDTPELRRAGVKIDMDEHGKVHVKRRD